MPGGQQGAGVNLRRWLTIAALSKKTSFKLPVGAGLLGARGFLASPSARAQRADLAHAGSGGVTRCGDRPARADDAGRPTDWHRGRTAPRAVAATPTARSGCAATTSDETPPR